MRSWTPSSATELRSLFEEAIARADPGPVIAEACAALGGPPPTLIALGKAAGTMARAALEAREVAGGLVVGLERVDVGLPSLAASHPVPDASSERAGRRLLEVVAGSDAPILALISGGGSSLAAVPADGLSLADKRTATGLVMAAGATIHELNTVRKHLSAIKGGRLAASTRREVTTLAMSDVVGDDLSVIASGPTVADDSRYDQAVEICRSYRVWDRLPGSVIAHLEAGARGERPETPKQLTGLARVAVPLSHAARAAGDAAADRGLAATVVPLPDGPVEMVAAEVATTCRALGPGQVWIGFGEPTVEVPAQAGTGGRAHHLALLLAREIAGQPGCALVAGTDGVDGNAPSAGAVVDGQSWRRMAAADPARALAGFDSYSALAVAGATLEIGRTGINFADLVIAVGSREPEGRGRTAP